MEPQRGKPRKWGVLAPQTMTIAGVSAHQNDDLYWRWQESACLAALLTLEWRLLGAPGVDVVNCSAFIA